ncbi:hypothetical protein [Acidobacterium sp. S8]|uniref:hypothetical protein n=1 Tax=Acidobacterium sp. S8 TaxID=1641854 RepID=UPI00131E8F8C|nr:hypothetical protein [Acidobacterium sp. S8]
MKNASNWLRRQTAGCLVLFLTLPLARTAAALPLQSSVQQTDPSTAPVKLQSTDSGATKSSIDAPQSQSTSPATTQSSPTGQSPDAQQQNNPAPVGTAAAPYEKTTGVAASRPAGAAIAPAKQKRTRSILIKTGIVIGACIAVGTVVALSKASPSEPH